uniref:WAP domain-containing protein n=1 Tax=Paramormyrops kingsleyae TaxID=1676925 RepID=A0A3B3T4P7_9TELE
MGSGTNLLERGWILWYGFSHVVCRAGACPTNGGRLPSTSGCTCDCDCPGKLKCCAYGTIRTCWWHLYWCNVNAFV